MYAVSLVIDKPHTTSCSVQSLILKYLIVVMHIKLFLLGMVGTFETRKWTVQLLVTSEGLLRSFRDKE